MSDTYTKLFSSITESTIVSEPVATRWLWVTMLAMANAAGEVHASVPGLARRANLSREETEHGLETFLAPDPDSRTKEHEGRRVAVIDGGWLLLNHAKYAAIRNAEERAEYKRQWDRDHRGSRPNAKNRTETPDKPPTAPDSPRQMSEKSDSPTPLTPTPTLQSKSKSYCPERSGDHSAPVVQIPLVSGDDYAITERQAAEFATAYPAVDVLAELRKMRAWAISNPKNRKTQTGVLRFANQWLARAQDKAPSARAGPQAVSKTGAAFLALDRIANGYDQHEHETDDDRLDLAGSCTRLSAIAGPGS